MPIDVPLAMQSIVANVANFQWHSNYSTATSAARTTLGAVYSYESQAGILGGNKTIVDKNICMHFGVHLAMEAAAAAAPAAEAVAVAFNMQHL